MRALCSERAHGAVEEEHKIKPVLPRCRAQGRDEWGATPWNLCQPWSVFVSFFRLLIIF